MNISPREIPQNWERQTVTHRCGAQAHTKQDTIRWWWWWWRFCRHFRFVLLFRIYHFCRTRVERKHDRTCVVRLLLLLLQPLLCRCMVFTRRHVGKPPYPVYRSGVRAFPSTLHTMYTPTPPTHRHAFTYTHTHTYKTRLASLAAGGKVAIRKFNSTNLIFHHPVKSVRSRARHHRTTWKGAFSTVRLLLPQCSGSSSSGGKLHWFSCSLHAFPPFLPPVPNFTTVALRHPYRRLVAMAIDWACGGVRVRRVFWRIISTREARNVRHKHTHTHTRGSTNHTRFYALLSCLENCLLLRLFTEPRARAEACETCL